MKNSILIIGPAATNCYLNQIVEFTQPSNVDSAFGSDSELSHAYQVARQADIPHIYLANVKTKDNYIKICRYIDETQYDVITPLALYPTDQYLFDGKKKPIACIMLELLHPKHAFLVTSHIHASAYDTIEHYISDMNKAYHTLKTGIINKNDCAHFVFVANNLANYTQAQVNLGAAMVNQLPGDYVTGSFGPACFNLACSDFAKGIVFFKNNFLTRTTIENYYNFSDDFPDKNISVQRILIYVSEALQLDNFKGRLMNKSVIVMQIKMYLQHILNTLKQKCIVDYAIQKIDILNNHNVYTIVCYIDIVPYFSYETSHLMVIKAV